MRQFTGGGGEFGGGGAGGSWDDEPVAPPTAVEQTPVTAEPTDTRVQRIVVSCRDDLVALETVTTTYLYRLQDCAAPIGVFDADVQILPTGVQLSLQSGGRPVRFHARFLVRPDQENPSTLLKDQATVPVHVVQSLARSQNMGECLLPIDDKELVPGASFFRDLFAPIDLSGRLWSKSIPLGEFGWITIALDGRAHFSGDVQGSYGPGVLHDICLFRSLGGGRVAGRAQFTLPASFEAALRASGALDLEARYLSVIPLTGIDGSAAVEGRATANGNLDASVEVIHDLRTGDWRLGASAGLSLEAILGLHVEAAIAARILTRRVWSESWIGDWEIGWGWRGGFLVGPDGRFTLDQGGLQRIASAGEPRLRQGAAAAAGVTTRPTAASVVKPIVLDILSMLVDYETGDKAMDPARDGLTPEKALPFAWHKPVDDNIYPRTLDLPRAITPKQVDRHAGPTQVAYAKPDGTTTFDHFGVKRKYWPFVGKPFQLVREQNRSDKEKDRFRDLVSQLGFSRRGLHIDHVHELQFGRLHINDALDAFENLWPIDRSANSSAGVRHRNQIKRFEKQLGSVDGRWFEIVKIGV